MIQLSQEPFITLEGEGPSIGIPTLFIRTFGCNLQCSYCDSKFSYSTDTPIIEYTPDELLFLISDKLQNTSINRISITGGEPTLQEKELCVFIRNLKQVYPQITTNLETNGTSLSIELFHLVNEISCDVKGPSSGHTEIPVVINYLVMQYSAKTAFKFVVSKVEDLDFLEKYDDLPNKYLMKDSYSSIGNDTIVNFILTHSDLKYSPRLQTILHIE